MQTANDLPTLKSYSEEEIDAFLNGDRRVIDRLLLHHLYSIHSIITSSAQSQIRNFRDIFRKQLTCRKLIVYNQYLNLFIFHDNIV